jgi:trans-aconitate methyltransferase
MRQPAAAAANRFSPEFYDPMYGQFAAFNAELARVCAAAADIDPVGHLVELGCGTGLFSQPLITSFRPRCFTGIDPNAGMIEQARRRIGASDATFHCDGAQNLASHFGPRTIDVIAVKAAFHLFQDRISVDGLLGFLTERGRLILVDHTARSASSFPLFPEARAHWDQHFARHAIDPLHEHPSLLARCSYGRPVRMVSKGYFEAIEHAQLSFTWPFDPELLRTWARLARATTGEFLDVYEEFEISIFGRGTATTVQVNRPAASDVADAALAAPRS